MLKRPEVRISTDGEVWRARTPLEYSIRPKALEVFASTWDSRFPSISRSWRSRWENVIPFFSYPAPIRKVIYTTNAIESIQAQLRKVTKKHGAFPTHDSVRKVLYLALQKASERWTMPIRDWPQALYHLSLVFPGRVPI